MNQPTPNADPRDSGSTLGLDRDSLVAARSRWPARAGDPHFVQPTGWYPGQSPNFLQCAQLETRELARTMANENLAAAKKARKDEFYTQWDDIQREMNAYLEYDPDVFRGKTVLLP